MSRTPVIAVGLASAVIVGGMATAQAVGSGPRTIDVCVKRGTVVSATRTGECPPRSRERTINVRGVRGPAGPQGETGPAGPAGSDATVPAEITQTVQRLNQSFPNLDDGVPPSWSPGRAPSDCILGEIKLTAAGFSYGLPANGQLLPIAQNTALFSLLGTRYGGDGRTTFALPDLRRVAPAGTIYSVCNVGVYPSRN